MRHTFNAAAALAATFCLTSAATIPKCGPGSPCPQDTPCCSQYGQCGVGAYCLGGCDPEYSYTLESCMAAPVCKSMDYKLTSLDDVQSNTEYLGDASSINWVASGAPVVYNDQAVLLTMAPDTVGTLLMSTHYVWYGKISATMTTSQGQGVVTAFILMSDVKDEIDFEFVGVDLTQAQSNYYWQGVTDCEYAVRTEHEPSSANMEFQTTMAKACRPRILFPTSTRTRSIGNPTTSPGPLTARLAVRCTKTRRTTIRTASITSRRHPRVSNSLSGLRVYQRMAKARSNGPAV